VCFSIVCVTAVGPDTSKAVWGGGHQQQLWANAARKVTFESLKSCNSGFQSLSMTIDVCGRQIENGIHIKDKLRTQLRSPWKMGGSMV
jgi:hypothetical protein